MRIAVISTYPGEGSRNIGDKLIELSTRSILEEIHPEATVDAFWRASNWEDVKHIIHYDHIVFACLAIRTNLTAIYPYLDRVLDSGIPYSVIAAGTELSMEASSNIDSGYSAAELTLLRRVGSGANVFTTRGALTQYFCQQIGITSAQFSGDVAFFDRRFDERSFLPNMEIRRIAISDPHSPKFYVNAFGRLVCSLRTMFPDAEIDLNLHGINPFAEKLATTLGLNVRRLYEKPTNGLDVYDDYDLHVGFRVHAHVSALKRRKYSYLLEQDGRGRDYGLTISRRLSVPCPKPHRTLLGRVLGKVIPRKILERLHNGSAAPASAVDSLMARIHRDRESGFDVFSGLEVEIASFGINNVDALRSTVASS